MMVACECFGTTHTVLIRADDGQTEAHIVGLLGNGARSVTIESQSCSITYRQADANV